MVQLTPPPECRNHADQTPDDEGEGPGVEHIDVYPGYEGYIENGLICLRHKVRNLEKKKLKLDEYKLRLKRGHVLNKDQLASVEKYDEVLHHLSLAQELQRSLDSLTNNLLRAQRKALRRREAQWVELERRRLRSVLQIQNVLRSLDRDQVRSDLVSGLNQAPTVQSQTLESLRELSPLLGLSRDKGLSMTEQMDRAASLFMDLVDDCEPAADSSLASVKEQLRVLVLSPYFDSLPPEPERSEQKSNSSSDDTERSTSSRATSCKSQSSSSQDSDQARVLVQTWDADSALKNQEPPDRWDQSPKPEKQWKGGAALVLKDQPGERPGLGVRPGDSRRREKKVRREETLKQSVELLMPVEVLALPTDPELRRQTLEELLTNINGAFSFVQDSVLDLDYSPTAAPYRLRRRVSGCPSPLVQSGPDLRGPDLRGPDLLPKMLHSTPFPERHHQTKATNGDYSGSESPASVKSSLTRTPPMAQSFTTPPSRRTLPPTHFNMSQVFKVKPSLPPADLCPLSLRSGFLSVSTQTPPEFDLSDHDSHEVAWSDLSLLSTVDLTIDSGHGASLSALALSSSADAALLQAPPLVHGPSPLPLPLFPLRVAFTASRTANFAPGNLDQPIVFDHLHSNMGDTYDARIGRFTCPAGGTYVFLFHILKLAINVPLYVNLMRNEEVMVSAYANDGAPDHETASNHAVLPLLTGDQVWLRLHRGAIYGSTWKYSTFSGFLLYQD